jgi:acetyl/propionyl-CoA carboxylase alpha subunit
VKYRAGTSGREESVTVEPRADGRFAVTLRGRTYVADLRRVGKTAVFSLIVGARSCELAAIRERDGWRLDLRGSTWSMRVETEQERLSRALDAGRASNRAAEIKASMPGFVTRVLVAAGDEVAEGTPLLIIEAMKMENEIRAECAGVIAEIAVAERQTVNNGDILVRIS